MQGKQEAPLSQPGGSPTRGCFCVSPALPTPGRILAVQREARPPRPPPLPWLPPAECPLGWYGPGCQSPCECEHQCPCDPQTGNCSVNWSPTLSSLFSRGTAPPRVPPRSRRGQTPLLPAFSLSLASCSEGVFPTSRGHRAGRRTLPFHQVGASVGTGRGRRKAPPSTFWVWPLLRAQAGLGGGCWVPDNGSPA